MILEEIVSQTLSRCGNPPQDVLHAEEVTNAVLAEIGMAMQELGGSDQDLLATKIPFTPATREGVFAGANSPPSFVQQIYNTTSDSRTPVNVVDISDLDEDEQNGRRSIAFFRTGSQLSYRFSWDTSGDSYEYIAWFNSETVQVAALADVPPVPENFGDMFADKAALHLIPQLILNDLHWSEKKGEMVPGRYGAFASAQAATINNRMRKWDHLWESWVFETKDDGVTQRDSFDEARVRQRNWLSTQN